MCQDTLFGKCLLTFRLRGAYRVFMSNRDPIMLKAIKAAGGPAALARYLGIQRQAVSQWRRVPVDHVLAIERLTDVSRNELRPDIYPADAA